MSYFLYVVGCADESLYAGISLDPQRRVLEHNSSPRGSRYTRSRRPVVLLATWEIGDRARATVAELRFKRLARARKLALLDADLGQLIAALGLD